MPRRRALLPLIVVALTALLAGCATASPAPVAASAPEPTGALAAAVVHRADARYGGARVLDDVHRDALVVVPKRSNGGLVVFLHGWSQTRWSMLETRGRVARPLSEAGYTLLSADARLKAWGDPSSVADYRALIADAQRRWRLHDVFLIGESMGGLATMQIARTDRSVRAVAEWYPVCDLRTLRETRFQPSIDAAWRGRDRRVVSPVAAPDRPLMVWASPDDTVVKASANAAVCVAEARRAGARAVLIRTSGNHGDPSNFQPAELLRFFGEHRTPGA